MMSVVNVWVGSVRSMWQLPEAIGAIENVKQPLPLFCVHVAVAPWQPAPLATNVFDGWTSVEGTCSEMFGAAQSHCALATVQPDVGMIEISTAVTEATTLEPARFIPPD